jgi:hypothetical protein
MTTPTVEQVRITPEMAELLLASNTNNRRVRPNVVRRFAEDMRNGNWSLNGDTIKIAPDGEVLDGQHRLFGCVQAGEPFEVFIVRNIATEARDTMDTGAARTFSDLLRWKGEVQTAHLASAVDCGIAWDARGIPSHRGDLVESNAGRLRWLEENPDIREAVRVTTGHRAAPLRFKASVAAPFAMRINRISPIDAEFYLNALKTGANLPENDPIGRFRNWLLKSAGQRIKPPREEHAALAVKSWNSFITGREIRSLKWQRGSGTSHVEAFPELLGPDGLTYDEIMSDPTYVPPGHQRVGTLVRRVSED